MEFSAPRRKRVGEGPVGDCQWTGDKFRALNLSAVALQAVLKSVPVLTIKGCVCVCVFRTSF